MFLLPSIIILIKLSFSTITLLISATKFLITCRFAFSPKFSFINVLFVSIVSKHFLFF
ncbi:hypothetical protein H8356DRAFT_1619018, partial [Neocallimastix lanati (nom. inval.)]